MFRSFISIIILFILSSCTNDQEVQRGGVIPNETITSKPIEQIESAKIDNKLNIALLVPLGKQKEHIGASLVKAAQLAIAEANDPDLNLVLLDSELVNQAPDVLLTKLTEHKVEIILGPLYGAETQKLEPLLKDRDITILSLSTDSSIKGDSLLMLGVSPDSQADTLVRYAISQGINDFYLLVPSNKYGQLIERAVADVIADKDNTVDKVAWYNQENIDQVIDGLIKLIASNKNNDKKAIFMPQGGSNIAKLNNALVKSKLKVTLIGGQSWDNSSVLQYPSLEGAILLKKNLAYDNFKDDFITHFAAEPNNIDFITYNGFMIIANMHKNNMPLNKQSIIEYYKYGKNLDITFNEYGQSLYNMSIIEIHDRNFRKVEYRP